MSLFRVSLLLLFLAVAGAGWCVRLATIGEAPAAFLRAAGAEAAQPADADVLLVTTPFGKKDDDRAATAATLRTALLAGKTVIVALGTSAEHVKALEALLPVNPWTCETRFLRGGCRLVGAAPLPDGLAVNGRYDLHLPYAAIEAGEHRYQWTRFGKDFFNTDWHVLLCAEGEGGLPVLVQGRYGAGTVYLFGADLGDPTLTAAPGYAAFVKALLDTPAPPPAAGKPAGLTLTIPRAGVPAVLVTNPGDACDVVLSLKVRNAERALLNSVALPLHLKAKETRTVTPPERDAALGDPAIAATADRTPFRYLDAALLTADRATLLTQASGLIDTAGPVTLSLAGQDVRSFDDLKAWPDRRLGSAVDMAGGAPIARYVYFTGSTPTVTVILRNGLHDIAPLAVASDEGWPDNPTTQGLNDLAYSHGSLRGTYPLYGVWSGKSAATQTVTLHWDAPVTVASEQLVAQTGYRFWSRSNPTNYTLSADGKPLVTVKDATYENARRRDAFPATQTRDLKLTMTGLDPAANLEPRTVTPANCTLTEWEVYGWPGTTPPPAVQGTLTVTCTDPATGKTDMLLKEALTLDGLQEAVKTVTLPARTTTGPLRVDAVFTPANVDKAWDVRDSFDVFFLPPDRDAIISTKTLGEQEFGTLCSPGFLVFDDFGLGTNADTQGWGGDDDKIWALTHDFMELGTRSLDVSTRMFTTSARFCHYTCPWRDFPDGQYFWDYATDKLAEMVQTGKFKNAKSLRAFFSDRWNGIPIGATFTWADFIRFDEYLRGQGKPGLQARSRKGLIAEITGQHADEWQRWELRTYADAILATRTRLAKLGTDFTVTTHGSFPLAGGELGTALAETHKAVGTDLFWELRGEDLFGSIGSRFGLVAANPDLDSGAYNEWGWVSAILNNPHWYAETGTVEPSRRQWYATYFAGRVTSAGAFKPYTVYGFDAHGGFGVKNTINDWQQYVRTMELTTRLRPEAPTGIGLVVSWRGQERKMGAKAGSLGFGLYAAEGIDQVDAVAGQVYAKLVKAGVPIAFVTSTHALKNWKGATPLLIIDPLNLETAELADLDRLNKAGTPIIGIAPDLSSTADAQGTALLQTLFGDYGKLVASGDGLTLATRGTLGRGNTLLCAGMVRAFTCLQAATVAREIDTLLGQPLRVSPGIAVTPFISSDRLFLALSDQGDVNRTITVSVRPGLLKADFTGTKFTVVDVDTARALPAVWKDGALTFTLPVAASDGRMVMIGKAE